MPSQHLAGGLVRQTEGEVEMIVGPNLDACHSVIFATSLLGDETTTAHCDLPLHVGSKVEMNIASVSGVQSSLVTTVGLDLLRMAGM